MGYCKRCDRRWTGLRETHCSGCCNHFSSVFAFDKHRIGQGEDRRCLEIEEMLAKKMVYDTEGRKWVSGRLPDSQISHRQKAEISTNRAKAY
jgi:hypothetical protein